MRRQGWIWALLTVLLLLLPAAAWAEDDPLVPNRPEGAPAFGPKVPLYDDPRFEPWDYTLEGQDWNRADYTTIYFWMNQLLVAKAWGLKMAIRTVEYAVHADLIKPFFTQANNVVQALNNAVWSTPGVPLVTGGLALVSLWALLLHLRGRTSRAWGALGGSVLILLLTGLVIGGGQRAMESGVNLSRGVAVELFQAVERATTNKGELGLIARSGDAAWRVLVYEPWLTGELSTQGRSAYKTTDGLEGGNFLAMSISQRHNACLYNLTQAQTNCPWWETDYLPRRMLLTTWTTAAGLGVAATLVVLGGSIVLAQLALLLFLALSPVWLMAALWWPEGGMRLVRGVATRAFGALLVQGILATALALWLVLTSALHTAFSKAGWMFESVLLAALALLVVRYRYAWLEPLATVSERVLQRRGRPDRRPQPGERAEERATDTGTTVIHESTPAFPAIPEAAFTKQVAPLAERERLMSVERERVRTSPVEVFRTQMEHLHEELVLRQETILYDRALEERRTEPAPVAPPEIRPRASGHQPDVNRLQPPRPRA